MKTIEWTHEKTIRLLDCQMRLARIPKYNTLQRRNFINKLQQTLVIESYGELQHTLHN